MILLTDGVPSANSGGACRGITPGWTGPVALGSTKDDYDCPLYFAQQAAQRGVTVYVVGIGYGVDSDFLKQVADLGADLELVFAEIKSP